MRTHHHPAGRVIALLAVLARTLPGSEPASGPRDTPPAVLHGAAKASGVVSHTREEVPPGQDRDTQTALGRARLWLTAASGDTLTTELAYEHQLRLSSSPSARLSLLPAEREWPYRIVPLSWRMGGDDGSDYRHDHEVDRAWIAWKGGRTLVTAGRQAIGLGRGSLFSPVDVFAPFSTLEVDREWRPGVDAVRAEEMLADTLSAEMIGVAADHWPDSALLGRVRGYAGKIDGELIGGKLGDDELYALTASGVAGEAEVHAELALFHTPEAQPDTGMFGDRRLVAKALAGGSYTFDVGQGLTVLGEYLYSEFGSESSRELQERFADPVWRDRASRGEAAEAGRHALGLRLTYPIGLDWTASLLGLCSATDGSGLLSPSVAWNASRTVTATLCGVVPWGEVSDQGLPRSHYGATPTSVFLQVAVNF